MNRRYLLGGLAVLVSIGAVGFVLATIGPAGSSPLGPDQQYPAGAEANHINFTALDNTDSNVSHTPREHWDSYAIEYDAPPERPLVEGEYYINSESGEILAERWYDAEVYRNGSTYAYLQPAKSIPNSQQREEFESDDAFVYDNDTDAYYRYDPNYGTLAPTNIGRHSNILEAFTWEAVNTTTHHGVPVITYQVTDTKANATNISTASSGTLRLGLNDGVIYAFDITLEDDGTPYQYTYNVGPAPFPEHDWVETAQDLAAQNTTAENN
jgi:hypothetical protein